MNAAGIDVMAKGKNSFHLKCLFFLKNQKATPATKMFRSKAVGFMKDIGNENKAIKAR